MNIKIPFCLCDLCGSKIPIGPDEDEHSIKFSSNYTALRFNFIVCIDCIKEVGSNLNEKMNKIQNKVVKIKEGINTIAKERFEC